MFGLRFLVTPQLEEEVAQVVSQSGQRGMVGSEGSLPQCEGAPVGLFGFLVFALVFQDDADVVDGLGLAGLAESSRET